MQRAGAREAAAEGGRSERIAVVDELGNVLGCAADRVLARMRTINASRARRGDRLDEAVGAQDGVQT